MSRQAIKPYKALFRIRFTNSLQYRIAALSGLLTQFVWGFMLILAFAAFYRDDHTAFPMTFEQTVTYIWMQQAFVTLFFIWMWENSIFESIESGGVVYDLVRPMSLYGRWATTVAANRVSRASLRALPILLVAAILPTAHRLTLPADFRILLPFLLSMALGFGVVIVFSMLVYISTFFTVNSIGTRIIVGVGSDFLMGAYIPIPFFPETVRIIVEFSPFGAMMNTPFLIFNGHLQSTDLVRSMFLQAFWLVILLIIGKIFMARALKRVVVQGG